MRPCARQALSDISVPVLNVTRLTVHNRYGVVYEALETPHLDLWAFYSRIHLDLPPMVEGQSVVPATNAVIQTPVPGDNGQLVVIADMTYEGLAQEDSSVAVFGKSSNFGNGTQKIPTPKTWSEPPVNGGKPIFVTANGYQWWASELCIRSAVGRLRHSGCGFSRGPISGLPAGGRARSRLWLGHEGLGAALAVAASSGFKPSSRMRRWRWFTWMPRRLTA